MVPGSPAPRSGAFHPRPEGPPPEPRPRARDAVIIAIPSMAPTHEPDHQGPAADPPVRGAVGLHRHPWQADHAAGAAPGLVAHAAGDRGAGAGAAGLARTAGLA